MLRPYAYAAIKFILPPLQKNSFNLIKDPGPVPERPISANTGLKFCSVFEFYLPMYRFICSNILCYHNHISK